MSNGSQEGKIKNYQIRLNIEREDEKEIHNFLQTKRNKNTYLQELILNDMNSTEEKKDISIDISKLEERFFDRTSLLFKKQTETVSEMIEEYRDQLNDNSLMKLDLCDKNLELIKQRMIINSKLETIGEAIDKVMIDFEKTLIDIQVNTNSKFEMLMNSNNSIDSKLGELLNNKKKTIWSFFRREK